ncbi:unnamed protein product [Caenorhabditis angaria]|uniref:Uncharacterized protein n=1 Tax=Caenorhabditis angaria TaxID=860376 RepID=A0A9P1N0P1_9PELO|nr:unnamed protein product [Caenorhabditis angaria]
MVIQIIITFSILLLFLILIGSILTYYNISIFVFSKNDKIKGFVKNRVGKWYGIVTLIVLLVVICVGGIAIYFWEYQAGDLKIRGCDGDLEHPMVLLNTSESLLISSHFSMSRVKTTINDFKSNNLNIFLGLVENWTVLCEEAERKLVELNGKSCMLSVRKQSAELFGLLNSTVWNEVTSSSTVDGLNNYLVGEVSKLYSALEENSENMNSHIDDLSNIVKKNQKDLTKTGKFIEDGFVSEFGTLSKIISKLLISMFTTISALLIISILIAILLKSKLFFKICSYTGYLSFLTVFSYTLMVLFVIISNIPLLHWCPFSNETQLNESFSANENYCISIHSSLFTQTSSQLNSPSATFMRNSKSMILEFEKNLLREIDTTIQFMNISFSKVLVNKAHSKRAAGFKVRCSVEEVKMVKKLNDKLMKAAKDYKKYKRKLVKDGSGIYDELGYMLQNITRYSNDFVTQINGHILNSVETIQKNIEKSNFPCDSFLESFQKCKSNICANMVDLNLELLSYWYFIAVIFILLTISGPIIGIWGSAECLKLENGDVKNPPGFDAESKIKTKSRTKTKTQIKPKTKNARKSKLVQKK